MTSRSQKGSDQSGHGGSQQGSRAATSRGSNETSATSKHTSGSTMGTSDGEVRLSYRQRLLELFRYLIFIVFLSVFAYARNYDYVKNQWADVLSQRFTSSYDWINVNDEVVPGFTNLNTVPQLWRFLEYFATNGLRPDNGTRSFDGSYLLGSVLLQQKRVQPGSCPELYKTIFVQVPDSCPLSVSANHLDQNPFGPNQEFVWTDQHQKGVNEWLPAANHEYGVGGYNAYLTLDGDANLNLIRSLKQKAWIDSYTVAVLLDYSMYNLNGNRICAIRLLFELPSYGGVETASSFHVIDAFPYDRLSNLMIAVLEMIFAIYYAYMVIIMFKNIGLYRKIFFRSGWNLMDIVKFGLVLAIIIARIVHDIIAWQLIASCKTEPYVDFQDLAVFEVHIRRMTSVVIIISWMRIAKYLFTMSNGLRMIKRVLLGASRNLLMFVVFFAIVLMGYVHAFFLAFNVDIPQFRSMSDSFLTAYGSIFGSGKFSFEEVQHSNFFLGPLLAFAFFASIELLLGHMFLAIVHGSYHDHRLAAKDVDFAKMVMAEINLATRASIDKHKKKTFMGRVTKTMSRIFSNKKREEHT